MTFSEERCREIAAFLRARRDSLQPEDVNLPRGARRRAPGLKREEVAMLAGVSTEWYTHLEQARHVRASEETLIRIGQALRLEPGELAHLLNLGGYQAGPFLFNGKTQYLSPQLQRLLDAYPYPAWISGRRSDILGWNRAATVIHGDLSQARGYERNMLYRLYVASEYRNRLVDWERHAKGFVGVLRMDYGDAIDCPWFRELIDVLIAESPEFALWWDSHHLQPYQDGIKRYDHPEVGRLEFEYSVLDLSDQRFSQCSMAMFVPIEGTGTKEKLARMLAIENVSTSV